MTLPLVERLTPHDLMPTDGRDGPESVDPEATWLALSDRPGCLFLDSAQRDAQLGRYSFVTADPFDWIRSPGGATGLGELQQLEGRWQEFATRLAPGLPPFQGGAAGLFGYELAHAMERLPRARYDEFQTPALAVGLYDVVIAFDHATRESWIISQGFPETEPAARRRRAAERLGQFREWLRRGRVEATSRPADDRRAHVRHANDLRAAELAPQFAVPGAAGLTSNFDGEAYCETVRRAVEYIHAGDVFQVNLAQRLLYPARDSSIRLYQRLRSRNPAPFACYFDLGDFQIVSASPERFLQISDGWVEARPIKGTRRRSANPEADLFTGDELQQSEKDRAENIMIVDLLRNDLARVCQADSVRVTQLCGLEVYQFVQHLVSVVRGALAPGATAWDLLRAAFPGGSITGAPKVRAMEIIAELEPTARGPYCGSAGYIGFDGTLDLSILIRTITAGRGWWQFPVGGGIVAQSDPQLEYEETWHKAAGLLKALEP